ncbi:MAG: hypothetical protein VKL59_02320 [Nostocaceae cyanobacterium]|nr:hypothetical protein [Nostocaceae cyanobacterium]
MSVEVDFNQWGTISLAAGAESWWWFTWIFDANHWQMMSVSPDNWPASIWIVEQWAETLPDGRGGGYTRLWCHFKNNGSTPVSFRPRVIVAPSRY